MTETREVFEMVTKQTEPDLGSWRDQERHQRKRAQRRRIGAFAVVAALIIAGGVTFSVVDGDPTDQVADQPTPTPTPVDVLQAYVVGLVDLTTGATSTLPLPDVPETSAIDVSPDGTRVAYIDGQELHVADIDGSNDRAFSGTFGSTGPRWSPDSSRIVFQGSGSSDQAASVGNLYVLDVETEEVRQITETEDVVTCRRPAER
jgi:hypothetical protein